MAEYIERETMIQAIREYSGFFQDSPSTNHMILKMEAEDVARDLEAADVAPVVHGFWDSDERCSACHEKSTEGLDAEKWNYWLPDYCPNCGAKMDLEDK